ncbi:MAG: hydroxymethylbilane synthase [Phycisphaerales bacterium]
MTLLRVGTRGSALALRQTRWVIGELHRRRPELEFQEVIIKTYGDVAHDQPFDSPNWPVGGFVGAIEQALLASEIDFAVHSYKDLPSVGPEELVIAAVPLRAAVHDVLLTRQAIDIEQLPNGFRIGTSSPRRRAQFLRFAGVETVPVRGNVPTRIKKMETGQMDGVVLAAAGLERLGLTAPHMMDLATDRFVPAPRQGALAIQTRRDSTARDILAALEHQPSRRAVDAEGSFLAALDAGCHTPVAALAKVSDGGIELHAQLFSDDGRDLAQGTETGSKPSQLGAVLGQRLKQQLHIAT